MRRFAAFITICVALARPADAGSDTEMRADRAAEAFSKWLDDHDTTGVIALVRDGKIALSEGFGREPDAPVELASLSKSITGVCVVELVSQGVMAWSDRFGDTVGGPLPFTLGDLLTHQSGLTTDGTQMAMLLWLDEQGPHKSAEVREIVETRRAVAAPEPPRGYHYSNENTALAALMIEAASGRTYQDVCHETALDPAGVSATPSPRAGAFLPWGGWQMAAADHALWHHYWFASDGHIAVDPKGLPYAEIDSGLYYGPGVTFRTLERGNTFWHFGALCFPGRLSMGAYVASVFGDWTVMAAYDACVEWDAMFALDRTLWQAIGGPLQ